MYQEKQTCQLNELNQLNLLLLVSLMNAPECKSKKKLLLMLYLLSRRLNKGDLKD